MALIDDIEDKWYTKAKAGFEEVWVDAVKGTYDDFVKGIATITGLAEATIKGSLPAKNFKDFQDDPGKYKDIAIAKIEAAYKAKKWSKKYKEAFGA